MKTNSEREKYIKTLEKALGKLEKEKISLPELKKEEREIKKEILSRVKKPEEPKKETKKEEEKREQSFFQDEEIIREMRQLLLIAKKKGVLASIEAARQRKNPLLLDLYHDFLVKEGFFKKFFFK
jgi:hypothetical protein